MSMFTQVTDKKIPLFDEDDDDPLLVFTEEGPGSKGRGLKESSRPLSAVRVDYVVDKELQDKWRCMKPAVIPVCIIVIITSLVVILPLVLNYDDKLNKEWNDIPKVCYDSCSISLVESIPVGMNYPAGSPRFPSIYEGWSKLIDSATESIEIASFYWTLRGKDIHYQDKTAIQGEVIFKKLLDVGKSGRVKLKIAQSEPSEEQLDLDTRILAQQGAAEVRSLDFHRFLGGGILHTKMWLIDRKHFYIGSANMDWRSLTQVKELGTIVSNCSCLAKDMGRIFDIYWYMGQKNASIPKKWPPQFRTNLNATNPLQLKYNGTASTTYLSSSPPQFCADGRTSDLDAILEVINTANKFVYVAVMDYFPTTLYTEPRRFWPDIDNALRRVSLDKKVEVRVLASWWNNSFPDMKNYLASLQALNGALDAKVETKLFVVPATSEQEKIPFARVNHNKYMVTDNTAYIGTSNWSGDYFISTGGIGFITRQSNASNYHRGSKWLLHQQLRDIFERDWNSKYAHTLDEYL